MGLKGKILKFMSDLLKDGSYYKLYTQAKSTSACGLPKGFLGLRSIFFKVDMLGVFSRSDVELSMNFSWELTITIFLKCGLVGCRFKK